MECTNTLLHNFSNEHFTYINQIFGDMSVRDIIMKIYKNPKYEFFPEPVETEAFESGFHHILISKKPEKNGEKKKLYCSVDFGFQNLSINKNDTLCQSYSLLQYLNIPIDKHYSYKDNSPIITEKSTMLVQREMINMYRKILKNKKFIKEFHFIDFENSFDENGEKMFRNYTKKNSPPLNLDSKEILKQVHKVLDEWEQYGYRFFMGTGKCKNKELVHDINTMLDEFKSKPSSTGKKTKS